ncbi:TPA: DUF4400 domain-containing protein [Legionella pneumophila]
MTSKKTAPKKKTGLIGLILASLFLSLVILYLVAVFLWTVYGYETALPFFIRLLKANETSLSGLGESVLSHPFIHGFFQKVSVSVSDANLSHKAQSLTQSGIDGLKEELSAYLSETLVSDAIEKGAGVLNSLYVFALKAGWLLALSLKIFAIKAFLLIAALPLFALLGVVGLVDGLSLREIRRAELGRESSYLFHMLNKWIARIIGLGLCVWVCMPTALNPQWFFVPLGLLFSMMLSLSASKFKKYL